MSVESTFEGIRPCPFCGQEADLVFDGGEFRGGYIKVRCFTCGAQSKGVWFRGEMTAPLEDLEEGVKALRQWNSRADDRLATMEYRLAKMERLLLKALETK